MMSIILWYRSVQRYQHKSAQYSF